MCTGRRERLYSLHICICTRCSSSATRRRSSTPRCSRRRRPSRCLCATRRTPAQEPPATLCTPRLQPYVARAATIYVAGLQPYVQAHRLKNRKAKSYLSLDSLAATRRVLLTGTPLQNARLTFPGYRPILLLGLLVIIPCHPARVPFVIEHPILQGPRINVAAQYSRMRSIFSPGCRKEPQLSHAQLDSPCKDPATASCSPASCMMLQRTHNEQPNLHRQNSSLARAQPNVFGCCKDPIEWPLHPAS